MESAVDWGGRVWRQAAAEAANYLGDLDGLRVLEIGFRHGEIARWFVRQGAIVTGVETDATCLGEGIPGRFLHYSGDLDEIDGQFDVVFCKSVLIAAGIERMLGGIERKLAPEGRFVFIENGKGGLLARVARRIRHPVRRSRFEFVEDRHIDMLARRFEVTWKYYPFPPVYLVCGRLRRKGAPPATERNPRGPNAMS
jgi:SAM-dependent methyltransferase